MEPRNNVNKFVEFKLNVTLDIVFVSLGISLIATIFSFLITKDLQEILKFSLAIFTTNTALLAVFYKYKNLTQNINHQITDRTLSYIQRWNSQEYLTLRLASLKIFEELEKVNPEGREHDLVNYLNKNIERRVQVITIFNFLTEMSICIQEKNIVDEEILKFFFEKIVISYCDKYHDFLNSRRCNLPNKETYKALIELCNKWKKTTN